MINKLFSSKARVDILKLFFFNPEDSFYQRQISKLSGQSIRAVQREVARLEELGIIEKSIQGNRIYYKVNKNCPIFKELKSLLFKSVGIAQVLKGNLKNNNIQVAFIYGSYARGKENLLSDIDLMVIGKISYRELSHLLSKPRKELMREINYVVFSPKEFKERVKQKDHFVSSVLKDKKIFIVGNANELKAIIKSR